MKSARLRCVIVKRNADDLLLLLVSLFILLFCLFVCLCVCLGFLSPRPYCPLVSLGTP